MRWLAHIMKRIGQLGFLRLPFAGAREAHDDGRVLHLFRNRAELKKSFSGAVEEVQRLKDRVKQQEGATARVQEMLKELEARLADTATAYPALVFYHLRELWTQGRVLLQQFIKELETQQLDRERRAFFADFNRRQFARRQAADSACLEAVAAAASARAAVNELERRLTQLTRLWHYFGRRRVRQQLHAATVQTLLADQNQTAAHAARGALEAEQGTFTGLSVDARRAINVAGIAYGQVMYERLARTGLLEKAQQAAAERAPPASEYGDRGACETLIGDIQRARLLLDQRKEMLADIRVRTESLRAVARYRQDGEVVPITESLQDEQQGIAVRVLRDDCWEINRALLR